MGQGNYDKYTKPGASDFSLIDFCRFEPEFSIVPGDILWDQWLCCNATLIMICCAPTDMYTINIQWVRG